VLSLLALLSLLPPRGAYAQQPPPAVQEIGNLFNQGMDALNKRDYDRAEAALKAAYERSAAIRDTYSMGVMLDAIGNVYSERGDFKKAVEFQTQALGMLEATREERAAKAYARACNNIANTYRRMGQPAKAFEAYQRAATVWQQLGDAPGAVFAYSNLGKFYGDEGRFREALEVHLQAQRLREAARMSPKDLAGGWMEVAADYINLRQPAEEAAAIQKAFQTLQAAGDSDSLSSMYLAYGSLQSARGRYREALDYLNRSLQIRQQKNDPKDLSAVVGTIADVYHRVGRLDQALVMYRRVLSLSEAAGDKTNLAVSASSVGTVLNQLGQPKKAAEYLVRALRLYEQLNDTRGIMSSLLSIGDVQYRAVNYKGATETYKRGLALAEKSGNPRLIAEAQSSLGSSLGALGQHEQALDLFQKAHRYFEQTGNQARIAASYNSLGNVYRHQNRPEDAITAYQRSTEAKRKIGDIRGIAVTQSNLATLYGDRGEWEKSAASFKEAIAGYETVRDQIASPTDIGAFQANVLNDMYMRYAIPWFS
jgi:tetratricopeptide (TPR) repeat protein